MLKGKSFFLTVNLIILLVFPFYSNAEINSIELNVNSSDVEIKVEGELEKAYTPLFLSGGILYSDDDYKLANISCSVKEDIFMRGLELGLGFKGIAGQMKIGSRDLDSGSLGFVFFSAYDFSEKLYTFPVRACLTLHIAPDPLCFLDAQRYTELTCSIYTNITNNAAIVIGYRNFEARFEKDSLKAKRTENAIFFGILLEF